MGGQFSQHLSHYLSKSHAQKKISKRRFFIKNPKRREQRRRRLPSPPRHKSHYCSAQKISHAP